MHATRLKLVCVLLASSLAAYEVAAGCNRSSLDDIKKSDGGWDDVYNVQEYTWADYLGWAGCTIASVVPLGQTITAICASEIATRVATALLSYLPAGRFTHTQLMDAIAAGGSIFGGEYEAKIGLTLFQCETTNCRSCVDNWTPYVGDCGHCGSYGTPEPNHLAIYLVRKKAYTNLRTPGLPAGMPS